MKWSQKGHSPEASETLKPIQPREILVPTDFSHSAHHAYPFASAFANRFGARLHLLYVVPETLPPDIWHVGLVLRTKSFIPEDKQRLEEERAREFPSGLSIDTSLSVGGPAHEICTHARNHGMDLMVMSTHGRSGMERLQIGSTVENVIRQSPCPVLVIPPCVPTPKADSPYIVKTILVPTDFSRKAVHAAFEAARWALAFQSDILLFHVVEPAAFPRMGYVHVPLEEQKELQESEEKLETQREVFSNLPIPVRQKSVKGEAAEEIARCAEEEATDLIVLGPHGRHFLKKLLVGNVTEKIIKAAPCPVLVVP